jgi:hypothetical protein
MNVDIIERKRRECRVSNRPFHFPGPSAVVDTMFSDNNTNKGHGIKDSGFSLIACTAAMTKSTAVSTLKGRLTRFQFFCLFKKNAYAMLKELSGGSGLAGKAVQEYQSVTGGLPAIGFGL